MGRRTPIGQSGWAARKWLAGARLILKPRARVDPAGLVSARRLEGEMGKSIGRKRGILSGGIWTDATDATYNGGIAADAEPMRARVGWAARRIDTL